MCNKYDGDESKIGLEFPNFYVETPLGCLSRITFNLHICVHIAVYILYSILLYIYMCMYVYVYVYVRSPMNESY